MNLVKQDAHVDGCAVACLAMVTGKTYEESLPALHPQGIPTEGYGANTDLNVLFEALTAAGIKFSVRTRCPLEMLKTSILLVRYKIGKEMFMHVVVWDAKTKAILDPWEARDQSEYIEGFCLAFELTDPGST